MLALGIETSCDETAISIVKDHSQVLSSKIASQIETHAQFGGVVPEIAARKHLEIIEPLFIETLKEAKVSLEDIQIISVTQGPGLIGALLVGASFAKGLASALEKPLVPVNHVHAHVHGALLGLDIKNQKEPLFPCLALVASGGHTHLYYMADEVTFELVASSRDDACGECFDKVAKVLGFPYPGGPMIEKWANKASSSSMEIPMPKVMGHKKWEFSYSGLKTHMAYLLQKEKKPIPDERVAQICQAFQTEVIDQIVRKLKVAVKEFPEARSVLVAGGVAANGYFRKQLNEEIKVPSHFPPLSYCSDNGAMIAAYGSYVFDRAEDKKIFSQDHSWEVYSRYTKSRI